LTSATATLLSLGLKEIELLPTSKLRDYPLETVIAEKFQAMMDWIDRAREGRENTRCASSIIWGWV
jgi:hypothetical protein